MGYFSGNADTGEGYIYVDTNGRKGPNIGCRDYWRMFYFSDASVDGWKLTPACKKMVLTVLMEVLLKPKDNMTGMKAVHAVTMILTA